MLKFAQGTLILENVSGQVLSKLFPDGYWSFDPRVHAWRCDARYYREVQALFAERAFPVDDQVAGWEDVRWGKVNIHKLRAEQDGAVKAWLEERRGVIVMPTGTGKTEVALSLMNLTTVSTLVVAPIRDLMYQWHQRIMKSLNYDAGIIGDNTFNVKPVSVTTYDSAYIHMDKLGNRFKLIIFDECHHLPGRLRSDAARMSAAPYRCGLTATPERSDGRHVDLAELIGPTVYETPLSAVKGKTLADFEIIRIPVHLSDSERKRFDELSEIIRRYIYDRRQEDPKFDWQDVSKEYNSDPVARKVMRAFYMKKAIEDRAEAKLRILEDVFRLHVGSRIIIHSGSNAMARDVSRRFLIPCLLSHCKKKERLDILEGFKNGDYPAIVANRILDEGVDVPEAKVGVVIGGSGSTRQAKQRLGRILRKVGNEKAILYEVFTQDTTEIKRSRSRSSSDAYSKVKRRKEVKD